MSKYRDWREIMQAWMVGKQPAIQIKPDIDDIAICGLRVGDTVRVTAEFITAILNRATSDFNYVRDTTLKAGDTFKVDGFINHRVILVNDFLRLIASEEEASKLELVLKDDPPA